MVAQTKYTPGRRRRIIRHFRQYSDLRIQNSMTNVIDPCDIYHVMGDFRLRWEGIRSSRTNLARQIEGDGCTPTDAGVQQEYTAQAFSARLHVG